MNSLKIERSATIALGPMFQQAFRFLIVSFDGLRPDLVGPALTPNLCRLKAAGVTLASHRTIYPSETRSAFPSLVTGATTDRHGMVGNKYVDRSVKPPRYIDTSDALLLRRLDRESGGQLYSAPSLGEILGSAGRSLAVLATNTPGTTHLFHHKAEDFGHVRLSGHFRESCTPEGVLAEIEERISPLPPAPPKSEPDRIGQDWITSAFLDVVWPKYRPDVTILSYGEPDVTSHFHGTGRKRRAPSLPIATDSSAACSTGGKRREGGLAFRLSRSPITAISPAIRASQWPIACVRPALALAMRLLPMLTWWWCRARSAPSILPIRVRRRLAGSLQPLRPSHGAGQCSRVRRTR